MKIRFLSLALAVVFTLSILPATHVLAQEGSGTEPASGSAHWSDVKEVAIWSMVSIAGGCAVLGVLYLFKRRIGAFPQHPAWVAPITIMRASDLPGDDDQGHAAAEISGHASAH